MELLESIRGSRLHALNMLEADLDVRVVWLSKLLDQIDPELREGAIFLLKQIRDYRVDHPRLENGDRELREQAGKILDEIPGSRLPARTPRERSPWWKFWRS